MNMSYSDREKFLIYEACAKMTEFIHKNDLMHLLLCEYCEYQEIMKKTDWSDDAKKRPEKIPNGFFK